jgi:hypothetical protein
MRRARPLLLAGAALLAGALGAGFGAGVVRRLRAFHPPHMLESFDALAPFRVDASDDVQASVRSVAGKTSQALQLDFDFHGHAGHAAVRRALEIDWPENFELSLQVRGDAPANDLQLKLIDASGENVWWFRHPELEPSHDWTRLRFRRRQLEFAWGPAPDHSLRHTAAIELVLAAGQGGKGSLAFDDLRLQELPPSPPVPATPLARSEASAAGAPAALAVDGRLDTAWRSDPARGAPARLELDLGAQRELGGVVLDWAEAAPATSYDLELSSDGVVWATGRSVRDGNGGRDFLRLPDAEARFLRLTLQAGPRDHYALAEVELQPPDFAPPTACARARATAAPRGELPRAFAGEQNTWTLVGTDGGPESALLSEDGALEVAAGGFSIEPFVVAGGRRFSWADVALAQSLREGYLPIPSVTWTSDAWRLRITSWAASEPAVLTVAGTLVARYELSNRGEQPLDLQLLLAVRPLQVNPPTQSLNLAGGVSPIAELDWDGERCSVSTPRGVVRNVQFLSVPDRAQLSSFDASELAVRVPQADARQPQHVRDTTGFASGVFGYDLHVPAGQTARLALLVPLAPDATSPPELLSLERLDRSEASVSAAWSERLDRVAIRVPPAAQPVIDTLRSSLAYILISRDGPMLRPGTRSYARSWIRDGAMMSEALLALGQAEVAASYFDWFAPYQFAGGKVPCCVDRRGADPVPENDSPGELIFLAAELYRYTGDRARLERAWPHIEAAAKYLEQLRARERTADNQTPERRAYYGLLPASISHEGYSDKPAYSYWDDFWGLIGYQDAAYAAEVLGKPEARALAQARDEFGADLYASLHASVARHGLSFLPASADRGDLDPTATTIALAPGREQAALPQQLLQQTFERYWQSFEQRRQSHSWDAYTPYELRLIGSFVRLGWRERAQQLLRYFLADRWPLGWNAWAEVVGREPRQPRFIGDRPHAWVASDYIRSVLDSFAYARDGAVVIAGGVPPEWLDNSGIAVQGLRTSAGVVDYSAVQVGQNVHIELRGPAPRGGFVLPWLWESSPASARVTINGAAARWEEAELRVRSAPAHIVVQLDSASKERR